MKNRFFKLFLLWMTALTFAACSSNTQKDKQEGTNTTTAQVEHHQICLNLFYHLNEQNNWY